MIFEMSGKVIKVGDKQTFDSGFTKTEFVIVTDEKFPQEIKFEATKERADPAAELEVGQTVALAFAINGNEYNERHYVNLKALNWKLADEDQSQDTGAPAEEATQPPAGADNIPF